MNEKGNKHLFVLIYGLWGNYSHMLSIQKTLEDLFSNCGIQDSENVYFIPRGIAYFNTLCGIEVIGHQTIVELTDFVVKYGQKCFNKISFVGYSMGGLVSRFVIGRLYTECATVFWHMEPFIYITFATPHLGERFYSRTGNDMKTILLNGAQSLLSFFASNFLGRSGRQMFLAYKDNTLVELAQGNYLEVLGRFKHRICLANVRNDYSVAFNTGLICDYDPFVETNNNIRYKYETMLPTNDKLISSPLIVDLELLDPKEEFPKPKNTWYGVFGNIGLMLFVVLSLPIFVVGNILGTIYSYVVTYFNKYEIANCNGRVLIDCLFAKIDSTRETFEDPIATPANSELNKCTAESWERFIEKYSKNKLSPSKFKRLPFDENMEFMFLNLNKLKWIKIPVHIESLNAHSEIIARVRRFGFRSSNMAVVQFTSHLIYYLTKKSE